MVKKIIEDPIFLSQKSVPATKEDSKIAVDLLDTIIAHKDCCVGMAANMIGINKRIIVFENDGEYETMFNPRIIKKADAFECEEGCLSLSGKRKVKRFKKIKVQYETNEFKIRLKTFTGMTAQIIQHEIDHCDGILI